MKKIRLFLLLTFCVLSFLTAEARRVDVEKAEKVARSYARATPRLTARRDFRLTKTVSRRVERTRPATRSAEPQDEPMFYVFTMNANSGFILVAGDDVAKPVLGYSDTGTYDENNPNLAYWMETLSQEIADAIENNVSQDEQIKAAWETFAADNDLPLQSAGDYVEPMIKTKWNQSSPYNDLCPVIADTRTYAGCVATTMAQIMKYYEYPTTRTVTIPSYITGSVSDINIPAVTGSTTYRWSDMNNTYSSSSTDVSKTAVAELIYQCGVSAKMNYTLKNSSASMLNAATALRNYFGYDAGIVCLDRSRYTHFQWIDLLKTELKTNRPIFYAGNGDKGGHAFVCDGYDANGLFHFNWGWSGQSDGYFEITALNPGHVGIGGGASGYNMRQEMIIGIQPDKGTQPVIRLGLLKFFASKSSLNSVTETFDLSAGSFCNLTLQRIPNVYLGVILYSQDGFYSDKAIQQKVNLLPNQKWYLRTILAGYSLPPDLPVGTYKLYPAFGVSPDKLSIMEGDRYIIVDVKSDGSVTLTENSYSPNLSLISLQAIRTVYYNRKGYFTAEITNNGTADYNSNISLYIDDYIVSLEPVVIPAGATKTVGFSDNISLRPGKRMLSIRYDPDNNPLVYSIPSMQLGGSVQVEVKETPTEAPKLSLASTPSFPNNDAVNINEPELTVEIQNTGDLFDGDINVFVFSVNGGQSITSFGATNIWLDQNEKQSIRFNNPLNGLKLGGRYMYFVYYSLSNEWVVMSDRYYFTAAGDVQSPIITSHPQTTAYYEIGTTAKELAVTANAGDEGALSYQWYRNSTNSNVGGTKIPGATEASYTPPTDVLGTVYYYVTVTNTNANATGLKTVEITSRTASVTVTKILPKAPPAPTVADKTAVSVTLNTLADNEEYSLDGLGWQDSPTFNNLKPDTEYTFYVRTKETDTHYKSPVSPGLKVRTYAGSDAKLDSLFINGISLYGGTYGIGRVAKYYQL
jgi:hypothetical protein